ncbi:MAG: hypothetical protein ACTTJ7_09310, partial [Treponema sp.]
INAQQAKAMFLLCKNSQSGGKSYDLPPDRYALRFISAKLLASTPPICKKVNGKSTHLPV